MKVTEEILKNMGFIKEINILKPNRYWCEFRKTSIIIKPNTTIVELLGCLYEDAIEEGISEGKRLRSQEFNNLINNIE